MPEADHWTGTYIKLLSVPSFKSVPRGGACGGSSMKDIWHVNTVCIKTVNKMLLLSLRKDAFEATENAGTS